MTDVGGDDPILGGEESQPFLFENIDISSSAMLMNAQIPLLTEEHALDRKETRKEIQRKALQKYRSKRKGEVVRLQERCKELERLLEKAAEYNNRLRDKLDDCVE